MNVKTSILVACAKRNKKQFEAAEDAGISQQQLSMIIKRNSCQLGTLERIAEALDYTVSDFIALGEEEVA
jgi:DNA-binding Xre family transcriptional regulator